MLFSFITNLMDTSLSKLWEMVMDRKAWHPAIHGVTKSWTRLSDWIQLNWYTNEDTHSRIICKNMNRTSISLNKIRKTQKVFKGVSGCICLFELWLCECCIFSFCFMSFFSKNVLFLLYLDTTTYPERSSLWGKFEERCEWNTPHKLEIFLLEPCVASLFRSFSESWPDFNILIVSSQTLKLRHQMNSSLTI